MHLRTSKQRILRTLRCKNRNVIGTLASLISTASQAGADIGMIKTVALTELYNVRDISVSASDEDHLKEIIEAVKSVPNVTLTHIIDEVLDVHQGGKIKMIPTYPVSTLDDLRKVYTPGVAQVCTMIKRNPSDAISYTSVQKNVALITNGSRVLGLGNLGPIASLPVMEGKAALFAQFTDLNMFPILIATRDPKKFVETVMEISTGFGAIQLEDIETPACIEIEEELIKRLDKPVMHDDQHGTAVVSLAAAINACHLVGRDLKTLTIGQLGLGAAGQAIARLISHYVGHPIWGSDPVEAAVARFQKSGGQTLSMEDLLKKCDLVICTTGQRDLVKPAMIQKGQIILALSNPYPEIAIEDALAAGAAFASDGTRVNNLLGYPGIFKGALEVQAYQINIAMLVAAAEAIAHASPDRELVPSPLDPELHRQVAKAVALSAVKTGVARYIPEQYA